MSQIEYLRRDGEIATLESDKLSYLGSELAMHFGQSLSDLPLKPAVTYLVNENCVDPRIQFLERCAQEHEPSDIIHQLATIYFGNDSEIADLAPKRMLIDAVARAHNNGCSMSWLPIPIGKQGADKSGRAAGAAIASFPERGGFTLIGDSAADYGLALLWRDRLLKAAHCQALAFPNRHGTLFHPAIGGVVNFKRGGSTSDWASIRIE